MKPILVSGLINIETTLRVEGFPLDYSPVRYPFYGIRSTVSGVGYNIAKALTTLGAPVRFLSLIGQDAAGRLVQETLLSERLPDQDVIASLEATAQSVILFEPGGRRMIHTDLKDIQEREYPAARFDAALAECDIAVLANINFSRPFLRRANEAGKLVATDVHAIADLDDDYNRDFMAAADILFMSDEKLPLAPEEWASLVVERYRPGILVIGLGARGVLLAVPEHGVMRRFPARQTRPVVNTIGAGDALFSSFLHAFARSRDPYTSLQRALIMVRRTRGGAASH